MISGMAKEANTDNNVALKGQALLYLNEFFFERKRITVCVL
jgi:hypothetical protein